MSIASIEWPRSSERHGKIVITNVAGNLVNNKGSHEDDDGWCKVATEVAPEVLFTVRFLIQWAAIVAITMTVGIVLIELGPPLLVLLSRVLVDLPLAILNALLDPQILDRLFLQLPLAIGHGLIAVARAVLSVLSSVGYGAFWVVGAVVYGAFWVVSSVAYGVFWVVKPIFDIVNVVSFLLGGIVLLRRAIVRFSSG